MSRAAQTISSFYGLNRDQLELDFINVRVSRDIRLYVDPFSIHHASDRFSALCRATISDYFDAVIELIKTGDDARAFELLSRLQEPNQTHLGLSRGRPRGRGVGTIQARKLLAALKSSKAVKTGMLTDLEDCALLIENVGPDKISDITTNIIRKHLITYTQAQCRLWGIPMVPSVNPGATWEGRNIGWRAQLTNLPVCNDRTLLLVPKSFVRYRASFSPLEYYQRDILEFLQAEHLDANTNLVRLLKSGPHKGERRPPTKKTLQRLRENRFSKSFLFEFSQKHPSVLRGYKKRKEEEIEPIADDQIEATADLPTGKTIADISKRLGQIPTGREKANSYHKCIFGILSAMFYPELIFPRIEAEIDEGRKRVDILLHNAQREDSFFSWIAKVRQIPSALIYAECKNYEEDPANPEIDQLLGRFNINNGKFGFLICRSFSNRKLIIQRCRDAALKGRGHIIALCDEDIKQLGKMASTGDRKAIMDYLLSRFNEIDN